MSFVIYFLWRNASKEFFHNIHCTFGRFVIWDMTEIIPDDGLAVLKARLPDRNSADMQNPVLLAPYE